MLETPAANGPEVMRCAPAGQRPADPRPARPYPLLRRFLIVVLPVLILALSGILFAATVAISTVVERVYEVDAARRHGSMVTIVAAEVPEALAALAGGRAPAPADAGRLETLLDGTARALGLSCVAVIAPKGNFLVGEGPACPALDRDYRNDIEARVRAELASPGARLFDVIRKPVPTWLVASVSPIAAGTVVIATLQDSSPLDAVIDANTFAWVGGLGVAFLVAVGIALVIVALTQHEIERRSRSLTSARDAIARFVSSHVRSAVLGQKRASRSEATVLFMDIRDFSSFAEAASPDETATLVGSIAAIGFAAVLGQGGDVDRLTGDGLIARFDGEGRVERGFAAAEEILARVALAQAARPVGIGLMDGEVIEATIAVGDRADATILGRTVNLCARLCASARAGELVASATMPLPPALTLIDAGTERLMLKGHSATVLARRLRLPR